MDAVTPDPLDERRDRVLEPADGQDAVGERRIDGDRVESQDEPETFAEGDRRLLHETGAARLHEARSELALCGHRVVHIGRGRPAVDPLQQGRPLVGGELLEEGSLEPEGHVPFLQHDPVGRDPGCRRHCRHDRGIAHLELGPGIREQAAQQLDHAPAAGLVGGLGRVHEGTGGWTRCGRCGDALAADVGAPRVGRIVDLHAPALLVLEHRDDLEAEESNQAMLGSAAASKRS